MGYNTPKTPFNLADFLSQKAPKRPLKRRSAYPFSRGSEAQTAPETDEAPEAAPGDLPEST